MRENIVVGIRIRPLSGIEDKAAQEHRLKDKTCTQTSGKDHCIRVTDPLDFTSQRVFSYDEIFDSNSATHEATQKDVYDRLGRQVFDRVLEGYNTCLMAYGVVGTGKTYSLNGKLGDEKEEGIVPRFLRDLFNHPNLTEVHMTYYELHNDRLHDLFRTTDQQTTELKVHHHPRIGVYIENSKETACDSFDQAMDLLRFGQTMRTTLHTNIHGDGSRSHIILRLRVEIDGRMTTTHFVDLAGRESKAELNGHKLKEVSFVNKSLFELANCIHALSSNQHGHIAGQIPFRNSKLTLLLSDCLLGNCKTHMLTTVSPAATAYHDTVSSLRFASAVKGIKCKCIPIEKGNKTDCVVKLEEEIVKLKEQLSELRNDHPAQALHGKDIEEKLAVMAAARDKYKQQWEEAIEEASAHKDDRKGLLKRLGLAVDEEQLGDPSKKRLHPLLMNLSDDAFISGGRLLYALPGSSTTIGSSDDDTITVKGAGVEPHMLTIEKTYTERGEGQATEDLHLKAVVPRQSSSRVLVNGHRVPVGSGCSLNQGDRIMLGHARVFRLVIPTEGESAEYHAQAEEARIREARKHGLPSPAQTALGEVEDEQSAELVRLKPYLRQRLSDTLPPQRLELFRKTLHYASSLVDEANRLTHEIRPQDKLAFHLAFIEGFEFDNSQPPAPSSPSRLSPLRRNAPVSPRSPQLVKRAESPRKGEAPAIPFIVRLVQRPPPEVGTEDMAKWQKAVNEVVEKIRERKRHEPHARSPTVADLIGISREPGPFDDTLSDGNAHARAAALLPATEREISVWSFEKFEQRLSQIRDIHRATTGDNSIAFDHYLEENPGNDPWRDWGPQSVSAMLARIGDLERRLEQAVTEQGKDEQIEALCARITVLETENRIKRKLDLEKDIKEIDNLERLELVTVHKSSDHPMVTIVMCLQLSSSGVAGYLTVGGA
ncbi:hypothetical protein FOL47_010792, partial [Perkinsus chesapeaki]